MTLFDYAMLAILAASLLLGMWRGFVGEVLAVAAWIAAFLVARKVAPGLEGWFSRFTHEAAIQYVAAFAAVFVAVLLIFAIARWAAAKLLRAAGMSWADRMLGTIFGGARAVFIALILVLLGGLTNLPRQPWWRESLTALPLETAVIAAKPMMPAALAQRIRYR
jgi:membrane protein required for colicin V production